MDYLQYKQSVETAIENLKLPTDCSRVGEPLFRPATLYAWIFEWVLEFESAKYIRVWEQYGRCAGLQESRRARFAFHYGLIPKKDGNGKILRDDGDPVDIRIDDYETGQGGVQAHLHYGAPQPHYRQESVVGLQLADLEMFAFIKAVLKHRKSGKTLAKILKFRIK